MYADDLSITALSDNSVFSQKAGFQSRIFHYFSKSYGANKSVLVILDREQYGVLGLS